MCRNDRRPYLVHLDQGARKIMYCRPDCNLWSCPECAERNKRKWTAIVTQGIEIYQGSGVNDWRFITITSHEKLKTFNQTLFVWREAWPKLYARMKRKFPDMKYVYLPEKHKDGRLHMHAISSGGISTRWLKDNARECGFGYKAESQETISITLSAFYCLKYITKSLVEAVQWPKSLHRVRTSIKWPKLPYERENGAVALDFRPLSADDWNAKSAHWLREGFELVNVNTGEIEGVQF